MKYYRDFYNSAEIKTRNELKMTSFLHNSKICIGKKTIKFQNLIDHDVFFIGQLLKEDDLFLTLEELNNTYSTNLNFLQYNSLISSIKKYTKTLVFNKHSPKLNYQKALNIILTTKYGTAVYIEHL